jgi:hypothetical protein
VLLYTTLTARKMDILVQASRTRAEREHDHEHERYKMGTVGRRDWAQVWQGVASGSREAYEYGEIGVSWHINGCGSVDYGGWREGKDTRDRSVH